MFKEVLYLTILVWSTSATDDWLTGTVDENGMLVLNPPGQAMSPFGGAFPMVSPNYPNPAQNKLIRRWRFVSWSEKKSALKVICYDVRLPKLSCDEYSFTIEDGGRNHVYCGDAGSFTLITDTPDITGVLTNGPSGQAYVNCTAEAILVGNNNEEITTPKPTIILPSYLTDESQEIDSSEHGGPPGEKTTTCHCGWANKEVSPDQFTRIVNGTETIPNEFPFMAALVDKKSVWQFCGATIITAWHALTATHCTIGWREKPSMALVVGDHDLNDDPNAGVSQLIDIEQIIDHQGYAPKKHVDDISLIVLRKEIIFTDYIGPACLPSHVYDLTKQYVKVIGWGAIYWRGPGSDVLLKMDARVVNKEECHRAFSSIIKKDNPTHLCVFATKKGPCNGDSGGPVVWVDPETNRYTLVGIASFVRVCADNSPSVHTNVAMYLDWIQHFVSVSKPNAQICYKKD